MLVRVTSVYCPVAVQLFDMHSKWLCIFKSCIWKIENNGKTVNLTTLWLSFL